MRTLPSFLGFIACLAHLCSCELNLQPQDAPVLAAESPWRDAKVKAASKEHLDKLKEAGKKRAAVRKLDIEAIALTEEQTACEKDMVDPKAQECYKNESQSDCEASKLCFWDYTRTKRDKNNLLVPHPSCWPALQDECVGVDLGCCEGEKRKAVNKKSLEALLKTKKEGCDKLLTENPALCRGRASRYFKYEESPKCRNKVCSLY